VVHEGPPGRIDVVYSRSLLPSYGFGGTHQNEELTASLQLPLTRALYARTAVSWLRNEPLTAGPKLRTVAASAAIGYSVSSWMGIEGFYDRASQQIDRPGGRVNRRRAGVQIVTQAPMRIR
jgi:hypothetical protein